jgi:hypothetical protein
LAQQAEFAGVGGRLGTVGCPQLVEDVGDLLFDGVERHHQFLGRSAGSACPRQQVQYL